MVNKVTKWSSYADKTKETMARNLKAWFDQWDKERSQLPTVEELARYAADKHHQSQSSKPLEKHMRQALLTIVKFYSVHLNCSMPNVDEIFRLAKRMMRAGDYRSRARPVSR